MRKPSQYPAMPAPTPPAGRDMQVAAVLAIAGRHRHDPDAVRQVLHMLFTPPKERHRRG